MLILGFFDFFKTPMKAFYGVMLVLDGIIYGLIAFLYKVFIMIASAEIFKQEIYNEIVGRVQIVLGILMLFVLAYAILRGIINPDDMDSKSGMTVKSIIPNVVKTIILIAIVPTLFTYAYKAQNIILTSNIIGKIVIGQNNTDIAKIKQSGISEDKAMNAYIEYGGTSMSQLIFQTFFYPEENNGEDPKQAKDIKAKDAVFEDLGLGGKIGRIAGAITCIAAAALTITGLWIPAVLSWAGCLLQSIIQHITGVNVTLEQAYYYAGSTGDFSLYLGFIDNIAEHEIHYSWFLSTIAGIFTCYILVSFCIDLALRAVKLGYYQIIAPVPIFANMVPKGKEIFDKWVKNTISTFMGVFIRVLVIFLVIFMIGKLPDWAGTTMVGGPSFATRLFARLFLILGLLLFAKQASKLISEVFGISDGSLKLGIKDKLSDLKQPVFRAGAAIGGAATAGARNFRGTKGEGAGRITSTLGGIAGGAKKGMKYGKGADSVSAMKDAAGKAGKEANQKAFERYKYDGVLGKLMHDMVEAKKKAGVWSGGELTFAEQAEREKREKTDARANQQLEKNKAARDIASSAFDLNQNAIKINLDTTELQEKLAKASGWNGTSDLGDHLKNVFGPDWKNLTYGAITKTLEARKNADGSDIIGPVLASIQGYANGLKETMVNEVISGKIGKAKGDYTDIYGNQHKQGEWINTGRADTRDNATGSEPELSYDPKLEAALQELATTLQKDLKELGAGHELMSKEAIKFFADGTKDYKDFIKGQTATIDNKLKNLGEILAAQKKATTDFAAENARKLSKLRLKFEEEEKKKEEISKK